MNGLSHSLVTQHAFFLLKAMEGDLPFLGDEVRDQVAQAALDTDNRMDLEFVDVEAGRGEGGRDNPHKDKFVEIINDKPHYVSSFEPLIGKHNHTAFNHFIDIKKGPGLFDDYDGYSYEKGSAHRDQFETVAGVKVDAGLNWWLNDEYVHAPGQPWYRSGKCSPSIECYSFPDDKGIYESVEAESIIRFPLANSTGAEGKGIPYSVFLPVDNLARYWFGQFIDTKDPTALGPVMHAIDDASIPHHAAGYMGNWHQKYEDDVDANLQQWLDDPSFLAGVRALVEQWSRIDSSPPVFLSYPQDVEKVPAQNWRIDQLVTWLALHAYQAYDQVYQHFRGGYSFNMESARNLTQLATALCVLVLRKALSLPPRVA